MRNLLFLGATVLASSLPAQLISPVQAATTDGSATSFGMTSGAAPFRYMQIHSDTTGSFRTIHGLAFRLDPGSPTLNFNGTRQLDLALQMGSGKAFDAAQGAFDDNYQGKPSVGISKKTVNFGPQGLRTNANPQPFQGMALPLDNPFFYGGVASLIWDLQLFALSQSGLFSGSIDAEQSSMTKATSFLTGAGCLASGQSQLMTQTPACVDAAGTLLFGLDVAGAPRNQPCVLALGTANPAASVPGLCGPLLTNLAVVLPIGSSDTGGFLFDGVALVTPNTTPGVMLFTQVHALDPNRSDPFKVCNSTGMRTTFPIPDTSHRVRVTSLRSRLGDAKAQRAQLFVDEMVGFGVVVRFS